jgi:hypothetical protein
MYSFKHLPNMSTTMTHYRTRKRTQRNFTCQGTDERRYQRKLQKHLVDANHQYQVPLVCRFGASPPIQRITNARCEQGNRSVVTDEQRGITNAQNAIQKPRLCMLDGSNFKLSPLLEIVKKWIARTHPADIPAAGSPATSSTSAIMTSPLS